MTIVTFMDLEELKLLIRSTLKKKIKEASVKDRQPSSNFSDFRRRFADALEFSGAPYTLVDEARDANSSGHVFNSIYDAWKDIQVEMNLVDSASAVEVWNDSVEFHVRKSVLDMISVHMNPESSECFENLDLDPSDLSDKVVQYFKR